MKKPIFKQNATLLEPSYQCNIEISDGGKRLFELLALQDHSVEGSFQSSSKITLKYLSACQDPFKIGTTVKHQIVLVKS